MLGVHILRVNIANGSGVKFISAWNLESGRNIQWDSEHSKHIGGQLVRESVLVLRKQREYIMGYERSKVIGGQLIGESILVLGKQWEYTMG